VHGRPRTERVEVPLMRSSAVFVGLVRRRPVTAFLVWFFTVGQLIAFVPLLGAANGVRLAPEPFTIASTWVGLLLPALVITWMVDGPSAVRGLLRRATSARLSLWWYAVALGLVPLISLGIACALAGPPDDTTAPDLAGAYLLGLLLQTVVHLVTTTCGRRSPGPGWSRHASSPACPRSAPLR
jgi:hypothetical protein